MATLVTGFLLPHDPLMGSMPDAPPEDKRASCMNAFKTISQRLAALEIDTVVLVGDDHYTINGPTCVPMAMIGIGDVDGPFEPWLGIPKRIIENNEPLAGHIMTQGLERGVDWAVSKSLTLDHSCMIPFHFSIAPLEKVRTVPIYINSGIEPLIPNRRAYEIGCIVGDAVRSWPGSERVAILGTGGISHWPGMKEMGQVNEAWDRKVIDLAVRGDVQSLIEMKDEDILAAGGNGGLEIKNWMFAMGACGPCRGELIAYEAVPEWVAGCGYLQLHLN
jgi:protocatechuate 4,5-dioxygenase beta chain